MKPIPLLGTLVLNRGDLLLRLFQSIDYPVDRFVIVNNGKDKSVQDAIDTILTMFPNKVNVHTPHKNTGVAAGWNWIVKSNEKPWYMIVGNDIQFTPGDMEKLAIAAHNEHEQVAMLFGNWGHSAFIITKLAIEKVGYFDENFYPAYLEDSDYSRRMFLAGVSAHDVQDCHMIHGEAPSWGSSTIYSNPIYRTMNGITHGNGFKYYLKKWGSINGQELYNFPYNNAMLGPKDWVFDPDLRAQNDVWGI